MKGSLAILIVLSFVVALLGGCAIATTPVSNPYPAGLYQNVKAPIDAENGVEAVKEGKACATNILGLIATGDASIDEAKRIGGIKEVASVDYQVTSVLSIFAQFCTIVKGK